MLGTRMLMVSSTVSSVGNIMLTVLNPPDQPPASPGTANWTSTLGTLMARSGTVGSHNYTFFNGTEAETRAHQDLTVPPSFVDVGATAVCGWSQWSVDGNDAGEISIHALDSSNNILATQESGLAIGPFRKINEPPMYRQVSLSLPSGTAKIRLEIHGLRGLGTQNNFEIFGIHCSLKTVFGSGFKKLSVASGRVTGTHTNFPVFIRPSAIAGLGPLTLKEAQSVRVYSDVSKTTELAREVKSADEIHVKVPSFSSSTELYIDYDGIRIDYAVTDTYGAQAVWGSEYKVVDHDVDGVDSTSNGNNGSITGDYLYYEETSVSSWDTKCHQGIAWDGTYYYTTDTSTIYKYKPDGTLVAQNATPFANVAASINHLGDLDVYDGKLYIAADNWTSCAINSAQTIVVYDASDLSYVQEADISSNSRAASGACVDVEAGEIIVTSFCNSELSFYDLSTFAFLRTTVFSQTLNKVQGAALFNGLLYVQDDDTKQTWEVQKDGTVNGPFYRGYSGSDAYEGITSRGASLEFIISPAASSGFIHTISPAGPMSPGFVMDGTQSIDYGSILDTSEGAISVWFKPSRIFNYNVIWDNAIAGNDWEAWTDLSSVGDFFARAGASGEVGFTRTNDDRGVAGTLYKIEYSWKNGGNAELFIDGQSVLTDPYSTVAASNFYLGGGNPSNTNGEGTYDELRITSTQRSSDWIAAEYNNQFDPGNFWVTESA